ncbi:MAG: hypothetical protein ABGX16_15245 [Pirellulales bacterium]
MTIHEDLYMNAGKPLKGRTITFAFVSILVVGYQYLAGAYHTEFYSTDALAHFVTGVVLVQPDIEF